MSGCKHENLKYCDCCDHIRCEDCKKTWGNYNSMYPFWQIRNPVIPYYFTGTTWTVGGIPPDTDKCLLTS